MSSPKLCTKKEGRMRLQNLSQAAPETVYIVGGGYKGITKINKEDYDSDVHTLVNVHGQELDYRGAVKPAIESNPGASAAATK